MASDYRIRMVLGPDEALYCGSCGDLLHGAAAQPDGDERTVYIGDPEEMENMVLCHTCYLAEGREAEEDESSTGLGFNPDGTERFATPCGHEDAPCCGCHLEMSRGGEELEFDDNPYTPEED